MNGFVYVMWKKDCKNGKAIEGKLKRNKKTVDVLNVYQILPQVGKRGSSIFSFDDFHCYEKSNLPAETTAHCQLKEAIGPELREISRVQWEDGMQNVKVRILEANRQDSEVLSWLQIMRIETAETQKSSLYSIW